MLKVLMLGPAGAGKGTQSKKLADEYGFAHISTGDLIRAEIKSGSELGNQVKALVEAGKLVGDDIVNEIVKSSTAKLEQEDIRGFILDGYPRTLEQAKFFDTYSKFDAVFNLEVPREALVTRLTGRRMCKNCGATFHMEFKIPKQEGICDLCGGELAQRKDDQPEAVKSRLDGYEDETGKPLKDYYTAQSNLKNVNGLDTEEGVFNSLKKSLETNLASSVK